MNHRFPFFFSPHVYIIIDSSVRFFSSLFCLLFWKLFWQFGSLEFWKFLEVGCANESNFLFYYI